MSVEPRVHLGLQACQGPDAYLWHGLGRYVREHTLHLLQDYRGMIAGLHIDPELPVPRTLGDFCGDDLLQEHPTGNQLSRNGSGPIIFHVMSPFWPVVPLRRLVPPALTRAGARLVVTLYDLIPLVFRGFYLREPWYEKWFSTRLQLIQEADHVLAISQTTRDDAVRLLGIDPGKISVIYGGTGEYFRPPVDRPSALKSVRERLSQLAGPFMFYPAGTGQFRKNLTGVIEAYARLPQTLREKFQVAISGHLHENERKAVLDCARKHSVTDRLVLTGFTSDELLRQLYQACHLCLYPSLYEGFGLPLLEAMRCGVPVVTSDRTSMKELMEIDRARFNPEDGSDIARVIESVLTDESLRRELVDYGDKRSREFTWDRVAAATVDGYRQVAASEPQSARRPRRHATVAIGTPFPPERSGIADYNRQFLETLCARHPVRLDVVVSGNPVSYEAMTAANSRLLSERQFSWLAEHGYYDSIIYCMGNSPYHHYIYRLLKEHPGTVCLHDVRLTDFYRWYYREHLGRDVQRLPDELRRWASRYPAHQGDLLLRDNLMQHEQGVYLAGEIVSHAQRIVVGSQFSRELIRIEGAGTIPTTVVPLASFGRTSAPDAEVWRTLALRYCLRAASVPIVSIGIAWSTKCLETIIDALPQISLGGQDPILALVGPCDRSYQRGLEQRASRLGVRGRVLFTGYVDEVELDSWLASASCALQLRFPTNGESSGAVMRCLEAGVPTIVSDHGPLKELPDDAVVKVAAQVEPEELARTITRILTDENERSRLQAGALRYSKEMSMESVVDRFWDEVICAR